VHLLRGEAHFNVAPDPGRPFVVEAGHVEVRAVGTAFNVRLAAREVEVLVTEGLVQVRQEATPLATQLAAGQQLIIPARPTDLEPEVLVRVVAPEVMREVLGWQRLRLNFADTALADVIAQFNRHNQVQIELADPELANLPVGGSFRPENVEAFVRLLVSDGAIRAERPDANRIVLHPAR
jgi:transmembrane sensor